MYRPNYRGRKKFLPVLFALVGGILFVNLFGTVTYDVSALQIAVSARVGSAGYTTLVIPPIGEISAATHRIPLGLSIAVQNIDLDLMRNIVAMPDEGGGEHLINELQAEGSKVIVYFALKLLALAGLGGVFGVYVLGRRGIAIFATGFLWAALMVALIMGLTYLTYDFDAFDSPEYRGIVEAAPWMVSLIQESLVRVEELGEQIQRFAANLYTAFQRIEDLKPVGILEADLVVLHVSDIHNNPVAYDFALQIIHSFPVDFVIDTGDLTDWGTPLEAEIVGRIEQLSIPYVFTSGNHDAPDVMQRLAATENAVLIDNGDIEVLGIRIAGTKDASAGSYRAEPAPIAELLETARQITEQYQEMEDPPDIFGVHNHRIAQAIPPGVFPVVVFGHNHRQEISETAGTVYINAGTTGAAGIRGLQAKEAIPFSLALLYFKKETDPEHFRLVAVDGISVQGLKASISLDRRFIERRRNRFDDVEIFDEAFN